MTAIEKIVVTHSNMSLPNSVIFRCAYCLVALAGQPPSTVAHPLISGAFRIKLMIFKNLSNKNYTKVSNEMLNNPDLDWKDIGLLSYLISKPETWEVSRYHLAKEKQTGMSGLKTIFKNLQKYGYMWFTKHQDGHTEWFVTDSPQVENQPKQNSPQVEKPQVEKPQVENQPVLVKKESYKRKKEIVITTPRKISEGDLSTAHFIFNKILDINPANKKPNFDTWANTIRLMRERDQRTDEEIRNLFTWANDDDFWKTNILSPEKLRKQWDMLLIKSSQSASRSGVDESWMDEPAGFINSTCQRVQ